LRWQSDDVKKMTTTEDGVPMKEPVTPEEIKIFHDLVRSDPQRCLRAANGWIADNPANPHAYFDRHLVWMRLGEPQRAIEDLSKVIALDPEPVAFHCRGEVYRHIGEYEKALGDFARGEAIDPAKWEDDAFGLLFQADCHARLGNEAAALACSARLPDDFWVPSLAGAPGGTKAEIGEKLRNVAVEARRKRV
jgi:tetratricopeptide (TPR) repeat protein